MPSQTSSKVQKSPSSQVVPAAAIASAGQAGLAPSHRSATSQTPDEARQTAPVATGPQRPSMAAPSATLQAWQSAGSPPPHAVSQQKPSTQKPLSHSKPCAQAVAP